MENNIYNINPLTAIPDKVAYYSANSVGRVVSIYKLCGCVCVSNSTYYPSVLLYSEKLKGIYNPIDERIMSLERVQQKQKDIQLPTYTKVVSTNVFYFIYNTDNYYHFVYDTLPYLMSYVQLKNKMDVKLLMNYPNHQKKSHYKFVLEFLELLGITQDDIIMVEENVKYENVYISDSFTHGHDSNLPPREEIYELYDLIKQKVLLDQVATQPKKIYISRRVWKHNDLSNIGTNYTSRRLLVNEDELVDYLNSIGYVEVFTELLSTKEKIQLFSNATHVVGGVGGGLTNALFCNKDCKITALCSPGFLEINKRFLYSLSRVSANLFKHTSLLTQDKYQKYMRVQCGDIVGEILSVQGDKLTLSYADQPLAGWNSLVDYKTIDVDVNDCVVLDNGLNCPWLVNLDKLKKTLHEAN